MYLKCSINISSVIIMMIFKSSTDIISLNSHKTPAKLVLSSPFCKTEKEGRRKFQNLPSISEPVEWSQWVMELDFELEFV